MKISNKAGKFHKKLPWLIAIFAALIWGLSYFLSAKFHGMQAMFDPMFSFFIARLLGIHGESMSVLGGTLFAMLDAGTLGAALGWLLLLAFKVKSDRTRK